MLNFGANRATGSQLTDEATLLVEIVRMAGGDGDLAAWAAAAAARKGDVSLAAILEEITPNRLREPAPAVPVGSALDPADVITAIQSADRPSRLLDLRIHGVVLPGEVAERDGVLQILSYRDKNGGNVYTPFHEDHTRVPRYTACVDAGISGIEILRLQKFGGIYSAAAELRRGRRVYCGHGEGMTEPLARRAAELASLLLCRGAD